MIAINLKDNISCEYLCSKIQKLLQDNQPIDPNDTLLVIELKKIQDSTQPIPKLVYQQVPNT